MKKFIYLFFMPFFLFTSCSQDEEIIDLASVGKSDTEKKVTICHYDDDTETWHSITINKNALKAHKAHGDRVDGGCEDYTYVPDDNFEQALIDLGYDDVLDDYVLTINISGITVLDVSSKSIIDITGIEDFVSLKNLRCFDNQIEIIDVSQNVSLTKLLCYKNDIKNLDVRYNTSLTRLLCYDNELMYLDVRYNTSLTRLLCYDNKLINLDLRYNTSLEILKCGSNNLQSLNVKNGNNSIISTMDARNNNLLSFIEVDNPTNANAGIAPYDVWKKDAAATYN